MANPFPAGSSYEHTHSISTANRAPGSYYLTLIVNHVLLENEVPIAETTFENNRVDLPFTVRATRLTHTHITHAIAHDSGTWSNALGFA
jgi:hypothetical protein